MKMFLLIILVSICSVFSLSCSGEKLKNTEGIDSLEYYKMAFEYIKESKEILDYGNKYGLLNPEEHLCVSSGLQKPTRGYFIQEYVDYIFRDMSDSLRKAKRDSIILLSSEYTSDRRIRKYMKLDGLAPKTNCRLQVFFRQLRENYLEASVYLVQRHESDIFSFNNIVNTSLRCFFIFENERIVKVFVREFTS